MLKKEENPALYEVVANMFRLEDTGELRFSEGEDIPQEYLDKITGLEITADDNVVSLKGVEKFRNLIFFESFVNTEEDIDYIGLSEKREEAITQYEELKKDMNLGQFDDISPLYQCKKLTTCFLTAQRGIEELDLTNWPKLEKLLCCRLDNLVSIKGLDKIEFFSRIGYPDYAEDSIRVLACNKLRQFDGLKELANLARESDEEKRKEYKSKVVLPFNSFIWLKNAGDEGLEEYLRVVGEEGLRYEPLIWVDNGAQDCEVFMATHRVIEFKGVLDSVVKKVLAGQENAGTIEKMSLLYGWITKNIVYDNQEILAERLREWLKNDDGIGEKRALDSNLKRREKAFLCAVEMKDKMADKLRDKMLGKTLFQEWLEIIEVRQDAVRSNWGVLADERGVCVGISNLYNSMLVNIGIYAEPCYCMIKYHNKLRDTVGDELKMKLFPNIYKNVKIRQAPLNHQMTAVKLCAKDSEEQLREGYYFFDPTVDLGLKEWAFFGKTWEEVFPTRMVGANHMEVGALSIANVALRAKEEVMER